ncbi:MAG: hypothetical protein FJY18_01370 [Bacteroidetes bacterium]|nr:hypothetical protein [Bacteroidota bacterium]
MDTALSDALDAHPLDALPFTALQKLFCIVLELIFLDSFARYMARFTASNRFESTGNERAMKNCAIERDYHYL